MAKYAKFVVALLTAVGATVTAQFPTTQHWVTGVISVAGALLVFFVPNKSA